MKPRTASKRGCDPVSECLPRGRRLDIRAYAQGCGIALRKFQRLRQQYKVAYLQWIDNRRRNIASLEPLIIALEETRNNCNIASLSGGCAGLVGGILTGAGLITIPLTAGISAPLLIAGASLAVSGGATGLGAGIADLRLSGARNGEAQDLIDRDVELTMRLLLLEKEYAQCLHNIESALMELRCTRPRDYDRLGDDCDRWSRGLGTGGGSAVVGSRVGANALLLATVARSIYLAKLGEISVSAARVATPVNPLSLLGAAKLVDSVDEVVEAGGQAGVAAVRGAKAGIAAAAVLCVVGLALDITSIIYTSRQIHVYRRNKQASLTDSPGQSKTGSDDTSIKTSSSTGNLNNNNRIYLRTINKELHSDYDLCSWPTGPPGGGFKQNQDLEMGRAWGDVRPGLWLAEEDEVSHAYHRDAEEEESPSRRSSGSWEKVDYTADMLIEVEEECPFFNKQQSLEFNLDTSSVAPSDTQQLIEDDPSADDNTGSFPRRLARRIKHSMTRDYISARAEKLKEYSSRLHREAELMHTNPTIQDLINECGCQQCACVGGPARLHCCHDKRFYWNCVYPDPEALTMTSQEVTSLQAPSRCVTQHPVFACLYLNETSLQGELKQHPTDKPLPPHRLLRYCAYRLIVRRCWGNNDITVRIPDCVRRVVAQTFQPQVEDFWESKDGFGISDLWQIKDSVTCVVM